MSRPCRGMPPPSSGPVRPPGAGSSLAQAPQATATAPQPTASSSAAMTSPGRCHWHTRVEYPMAAASSAPTHAVSDRQRAPTTRTSATAVEAATAVCPLGRVLAASHRWESPKSGRHRRVCLRSWAEALVAAIVPAAHRARRRLPRHSASRNTMTAIAMTAGIDTTWRRVRAYPEANRAPMRDPVRAVCSMSCPVWETTSTAHTTSMPRKQAAASAAARRRGFNRADTTKRS